MKLYIPTSTLNFNSLMSTESISPVSFYNLRKFGIKRFNRVEPNNFDNSILLYSKIPDFIIPDDGLDNYPLIIEVDSKKIPENTQSFVIDDLTIFQCQETIYFNPIETKIYFTSENHKRICLSKSQQSIEAKLTILYSNSYEIISSQSLNKFTWDKSLLTKIKDFKANNLHGLVSKDNALDKIKGFAYSYIIGANNSLSYELINIKKICREIQNIVSAIITSPNSIASKSQSDRLNECVAIFTAEYEKVDENEKRINDYLKLILSKYDKLNTDELTTFLQKEDLYDFLKERVSAKQGIQIFRLDNEISKTLFSKNENRLSDFNTKINNLISRLEILYFKSKDKVDINNLFSIPFFKLTEIKDNHFPANGTKFFISLVNEYTSEAWVGKDFSIQRLDITVAGGRLLKEFTIEYKKEWENSPEQKYINELLDSIQNYKPFDIKSHASIVLQSFAAFILKGDDIQKLESFLIQNNITDYRIAFALFGALYGFAELPKTFTNFLFETKDKLYLTAIYKNIYKQIHDLDIDGVITEPRMASNTFKPDKPTSISIGSKLNNIVENITHKNPENSIRKNDGPLVVELKNAFPKISKPTEKKITELLKKYSSVNEFFIDELYEIKKIDSNIIEWFKTYNVKNRIVNGFSTNNISEIPKSQIIPNIEPELFQPKFSEDKNAWKLLEHLKYDSLFVQNKVKKNLEEIQKGYNEGGYYYQRGDSKNEKDIIDHFINLLTSDKNKFNKLDLNQVPTNLKEEIREILYNHYCK